MSKTFLFFKLQQKLFYQILCVLGVIDISYKLSYTWRCIILILVYSISTVYSNCTGLPVNEKPWKKFCVWLGEDIEANICFTSQKHTYRTNVLTTILLSLSVYNAQKLENQHLYVLLHRKKEGRTNCKETSSGVQVIVTRLIVTNNF